MSDNIEEQLDSELLDFENFQKLRNEEFKDVNRELQDFILNNHSKVLTHLNKYLSTEGVKAQIIYVDHLITGSYYVATGGLQLATQPAPFRRKYIDYIVGIFKEAGYDVNVDGQLVLDK